jgi:hypothetical protein
MGNLNAIPCQIEGSGSTGSALETPEDCPGISGIQFHFEVSEKSPPPRILDANEDALRSLISAKYLASLSHPLLEEIAKNVAEAMIIIQQKKRTVSLGLVETGTQPGQDITRQNCSEAGRKTQKAVFACEHPGCITTFNRKKDRKRHFRQKHQGNKHFRCPLVTVHLAQDTQSREETSIAITYVGRHNPLLHGSAFCLNVLKQP